MKGGSIGGAKCARLDYGKETIQKRGENTENCEAT